MTDSEQHSRQSCLDAAYRYLAYRPRSRLELERYLAKKGCADAGSIMDELAQKGLLDDAAFARFWRSNRDSFHPRSRSILRSELRAKGVSADIIDEVLIDVDDMATAYEAAARKARRYRSEEYEVFRRRIGMFLRRRGFSHEVAQAAMQRLWEEGGESA